MPKDNENVRLPFTAEVTSSEPQGFSPDQMIRCDECLRANPPTRMVCLYCSAPLTISQESLRFLQPTLRPPGKHELGYNIIRSPNQSIPTEVRINEAATLLKISTDRLERLLNTSTPLPLAQTASLAEAQFVCDRLNQLGLMTQTLSDDDLGLASEKVQRVRAMGLDEKGATLHQSGLIESHSVPWSSFVLIVTGRLLLRRVEVKERKMREGENEIVSTSEFFADESVIDLYSDSSSKTWRIPANGLDFSCLENEKSLLANENIVRLAKTIVALAPQAVYHEEYPGIRQLLDPVWGVEQQTQSSGWKRESPGKYSLGAATIESSETQFTRYSRLQFYFLRNRVDGAN